MNKPTPTTHGAWRVIDGRLVNEAAPVAGVPPQIADETPSATPARQRNNRTAPAATPSDSEE